MKILVVTLSNLGDVVLTYPVFQSVLKAFPGARVDAIVGSGASAALEGDARLGVVKPYVKRSTLREKIELLKSVRAERYDVIVDLRYSLLGFLGNAKKRNRYFFKRRPRGRHKALLHLSALEGICEPDLDAPFLSARPAEGSRGTGRVVVASVGSKSDVKKWPAAQFARLLDRLAAEEGCRIVLVGDKNDVPDAARVKGLMRSPAEDLTGRTDFEGLCRVIAGADLVVTNDSAPLHIADALRVPVLAFFGPTDPRKYGPRQPRSLAVRKPVFCSPCEKAQCRFGRECLETLSADEAYAKALQILHDEYRPRNLNILVLRLDRLGDVLLSLPAIAALRERFPNATISLAVRPYTSAIVEGHPLVDEVIEYRYEKRGRHAGWLGGLRFVREIAMRRFDAAIVLHPSNRAALVPFLAGIPYRVGLDAGPSYLLTKRVPDLRRQGSRHESEYALEIVRAFGATRAPAGSHALPVPAPDDVRAAELLAAAGIADGRVVAFHPGASCASKRWDADRFAEVARRAVEEDGCRVVVIGGAEEKARGAQIAAAVPGAADFTGKLTLKELAAVLARCRALVSNDSGPVHVAAAVGTPCVVVFGRNQAGLSVRRWKPLGERHVSIRKDVGCVVCLAHDCPIEFECLKAVSPQEVLSALRGVLSAETAGAAR